MRHLTHLRYIDVVARERSIRKASEKLNITSTALNRRILALEDEVGTPLFERLPSGVRLNTAGELFIQHIRSQMTDLSRVLSQISDLSGVRRGHVTISGGPELLASFLPKQIAQYRQEFEAVQFDVVRHTPAESLAALIILNQIWRLCLILCCRLTCILWRQFHSRSTRLCKTATRWPQTAYSNCRIAWPGRWSRRRQIAG